MKSRASEKPTQKTKKTTAAKSVKKPAKKSVRSSSGKTVVKKAKTATKAVAKRKAPTKAPAKTSQTKPVGVKATKPKASVLQPEPPTPPAIPSQAADQILGEESPLASTPPVFVKRDLTGPDGSKRPGWEMWIGDHCFGRADSKDLLLASFERLQSPPSSFHWREVRNRMPMRGRPKGSPASKKAAGQEGEHEEEVLDEGDVGETQEVS